MERTSRFRKNAQEYICTHQLHFGTSPKPWKPNHRCLPENCRWLIAKAKYEQQHPKSKVIFIGD